MFEQRPNPLVLPKQETVGVFFGFRGMPATITIQRADGTYVDGVKVDPQEAHGSAASTIYAHTGSAGSQD